MAELASIGSFVVEEKIGSGGMGDVWRGRHRASGLQVAVKVPRIASARGPVQRERFRREVRAVAGLQHPCVVEVFDHGEISSATEDASGGALGAGSPFLVMELATRGALSSAAPLASFDDLRAILTAVLDALAHTHARGVVHRDVKPGNVLLGATGPKLGDFGIAHAWTADATQREAGAGGTPAYMAPEAFGSRWFDFGPESDLYSVGCVAHELACGVVPFTGRSARALAQAHAHAAPPPLAPRFEVPDAFEDWIAWLLEKEPARRPRLAADARGALHDLRWPSAGERRVPHVRREVENDVVTQTSGVVLARAPATRSDPSAPGERSTAARGAPRFVRPVARRIEHDVDEDPERPWHRGLVGAGLGLFPWRTHAIVGRKHERAVLWSELDGVIAERACRVVLLEGPAGVGKSRLSEWLGQRAMELGHASFLRATFGADSPDGLAQMLAAHFRCSGASPVEARERVAASSLADDPLQIDAVVELMAPALGAPKATDASPVRGVRFDSPAERHGGTASVLRRLTEERAVTLVLDGAEHADDAIGLALHLQAALTDVPLLVVLTLDPDAGGARLEHQRDALGALRDAPRTTRLPLEPLGADDQAHLVRHLLHLEGGLGSVVEERARGNPLFAIELVRDWVDRGILTAGAHGFELAAGAEATLPEKLRGLFARRLDLAARGRPEAMPALRVAALLGADVDTEEWREVAASLGMTLEADDIDGLVRQRLLCPTSTGLAFPHAVLREAILAETKAPEAAVVHGAIAAVLRRRNATTGFAAERLAHHLLGQGAPEEAIPALITALRFRVGRSEHGAAFRIAAQIEATLDASGVPEDARQRIETRLGRCWLLRRVGRLDDAEALAHTCLASAERAAASDGIRHALAELADVALRRGANDVGVAHLMRAMTVSAPDDSATARVAWTLGWLLLLRGDHASARGLFQRSLDADTGDLLGLSVGLHARWSLGMALLAAGERDEARRVSRQALAEAEAHGSRLAMAHAQTNLALLDDDPLSGERAARAASATFEHIASPERWRAAWALARALALQARHDEALVVATACTDELTRAGRERLTLLPTALEWECRSALGDDEGAVAALHRAQHLYESGRVATGMVAEALERGALHALARRQLTVAASALALAASQWAAVGDRTAAERVREQAAVLE